MKLGFRDLWGWFQRRRHLGFRYLDACERYHVDAGAVRVMNAVAAQPYVLQAEAAQCTG